MKKPSLRSIIIFSAFSLMTAICFLVWHFTGDVLVSQKAAERWDNGSELEFRQFSVFLPESSALTVEDIYEFRSTIISKMSEVSLEQPERGSLFCDAWSTSGKLTVYGDNGSGEASVVAVGGNYFHFHPLTLVNGNYISENDLMQDRVLLDEDMAWLLFGGTDLVGMTVTINDLPFVIAGVISREEDKASVKTYSDGSGIYMSYDAFADLSETGIDCYEIVMAEPVDGFAAGVLEENFDTDDCELVENSSRYSVANGLELIAAFGTRSMRSSAVAYPYWENAARYYEDWCALFLLLGMLFAVCPLVLLLVLLFRLCRIAKASVAAWLPSALSEAKETISSRIYDRKSSRSCRVKKDGGSKHGKRYAEKY